MKLYFELGVEHILSLSAWDHILFLLMISFFFPIQQFKKIIYLVSFFTLGHFCSILMMYGLKIYVNSNYIEALIPLTIILAAYQNLKYAPHSNKTMVTPHITIQDSKPTNNFMLPPQKNQNFNITYLYYAEVLFFGIIHGTAFAQTLVQLLDKKQQIVLPLISFNIGVELGQIIFLCFFVVFINKCVPLTKIKQNSLKKWLSAFTIIVCFLLFLKRLLNY
ncbi:MAG: HupE/UreJ family protein [Alphaproteobacteria bacterium]|nr:HupE/UreJ family protein [Alphaproteobacteria bacterium]